MRDSVGSVGHHVLLFKRNVVNYTYCILRQPRRMVFYPVLKYLFSLRLCIVESAVAGHSLRYYFLSFETPLQLNVLKHTASSRD